tara:strand:- start:734 stop:3241 length:2508 start_codon:yes stop_codon:yes gene_type:complete
VKPINAIGFIFNAFAHVTDGEQLSEELVVVADSLQLFQVDKEQFLEIYEWYTDVHSKGEEELQNTLQECISVVVQFFNQNDSDKVIRMIFIEQLVNIAKADGVIKDSEKTWLKNFCKVMEVDEPTSMHESINDEDVSSDVSDNIEKPLVDNSTTIAKSEIMTIICDQSSTLDQIKEVVEADPNAVHAQQDNGSDDGYSPLHYAAWDSKADIVKYLIDNGADVNLKGKDGCSPIVLCGVTPNQTDCVKLLIENGAVLENRNMEPNMYHPKGATVLRLAVINCCYDTADYLIEKGASLDALLEPCDKQKVSTSDFFVACTLVHTHFPDIYNLERLVAISNIVKAEQKDESNDDQSEKSKNNLQVEEDEKEDSSNKGPMALSHKNKSEDENKFLRNFIVKWMAETEDFAYSMSKIQFPSFLKEIDDACPVFTDDEITFINHHIDYEKCIPSLPYVHDPTFYNHTKQVWWVAPCVYWGEQLVSWVMVDKNGFYAPHPENWDDQDDVSAIFSWEMIEDISFDIDEFEDHAIATLNIEATNGGELTFHEFLSLNKEVSKAAGEPVFRGSYLSVFKSIFDVNYENIIQSRGAHAWYHGVGMEGMKAFKDPSELLNQSIWQEARTGRMNYKTNEIFDYNPDGEQDSAAENKIEDKSDEKVSSNKDKTESSANEYYFEDYIGEYKLEHVLIDERLEHLLETVTDFIDEKLDGTDGLLQVCSRTGGYSLYADNKLRNGKFAQCRFGKSDRKEGKPVNYFVDLYLLKSKMNYSIDSLPEQSLQSPHAHEFYVVRLYSQDDFKNNKDILEQRLKESLQARQKNKLITKRKNLSKKQLKSEYLKDLGL